MTEEEAFDHFINLLIEGKIEEAQKFVEDYSESSTSVQLTENWTDDMLNEIEGKAGTIQWG